MRHGIGLAAALAAMMAAAPARAQVTAEQALALQTTLRNWAAGLLTPLIQAAAVPVAVSADGARYRLEYAPGSGVIPGFTVTSAGNAVALVRPLDGTRWAIEDFTLPSDFEATFDLGGPAMSGRMAMHIGEQKFRAEFDPTLATPSRSEGVLSNIVQTVQGEQGPQTTRIARVTGDSTWTPAGPDTINAAVNSAMEGYAADTTLPDGTKLAYTIANTRLTLRAEGVDMARVGTMVRAASSLTSDIRAELTGKVPGASAPTDAQRATMRTLVQALAATFTRIEGKEELTGMKFAAGGMEGTLAKLELGSAIGAPGGNAEFRLRIGVEGFDSAVIPPGAIRGLVPRRVVLAPRISGMPKSTLMDFLSHAIDVAGDPDAELDSDAMQMLADNPLTIGIDELLVELGLGRLTGTGQVQVSSPTEITGAAELRMTGLDPLIRLLGQLPETKMAVPVAIILKGIGKVEGSETVWRIAYADGKTTVNGTDLAALMPGGPARRK